MRAARYVALALVVAGLLVTIVGSGGTVSVSGERGGDIETVDDPDAYVGLEYPEAEESGDPIVELIPADGNLDCDFGFDVCWFGDMEYDNVRIVTISDQTDTQLSEDYLTHSLSGDVDGDTEDVGSLNTEITVQGDFTCDVLFGQQQEASGEVTVTLETSSDEMTVELDRQVDVECASQSTSSESAQTLSQTNGTIPSDVEIPDSISIEAAPKSGAQTNESSPPDTELAETQRTPDDE